ncbi:MAG: TSUP family transporter, partial [Bacteroidota bacterium]
MQPTDLILAGLAAIAAGFVNAIAGGGTLITFPVLMALGIPPVAANITNTIALCPGYFGGTYAQRKDLSGQKNNILSIIPAGILGGITGGLLLIYTEEKTFKTLVPYLILIATILLAFQPLIKKLISKKSNSE